MKERNAYVCEKCQPPHRVFLLSRAMPVPRCKQHGLMVRQTNTPYNGRRTEPDKRRKP